MRFSSLMVLLGTVAGCAFAGSTLAGCAEGGGGGTDGGGARDAARRDAGQADGGDDPGDGGARDGGRRDSGPGTECDPGQHACGGGCIDDLPNEPANGCRLGCGEPCPEPPSGELSCTSAGTCSFECTPPYRPMDGTCVCAPFTCEDMGWMCGSPDDGCGRPLDCGSCGTGACIDGACSCAPDAHESDDSRSSVTSVGTYSDSDDPPDAVIGTHTLDEAGDVDWIRYDITDGTDGGNPRLTVTLDQIPTGSAYTLSAFYVCDGGTDASTCAAGTADNEVGRGCTAMGTGSSRMVEVETECEHISTDETGTLYVRVRAATWASTCGPYRVTLRVR